MPFYNQHQDHLEHPRVNKYKFNQFLLTVFKQKYFKESDLVLEEVACEYNRREKDKENNNFDIENYRLFFEVIKLVLESNKFKLVALLNYEDNEEELKKLLREFKEFEMGISIHDVKVIIKHFIRQAGQPRFIEQ
jgi:hypothetical protein